MYQTTATRPAPSRPAAPSMLAGHQVTPEMARMAQSAKDAGRRVALILLTEHGDETEVRGHECANCCAAGYLGLEVFMAGPFDSIPGSTVKNGEAVILRIAAHNNKWWQVSRQIYPCPLCGPQTKEIVL